MSGMFPVASFPCICYRTEDYHCVSVSRLFGSPLSQSIFVYKWPRHHFIDVKTFSGKTFYIIQPHFAAPNEQWLFTTQSATASDLKSSPMDQKKTGTRPGPGLEKTRISPGCNGSSTASSPGPCCSPEFFNRPKTGCNQLQPGYITYIHVKGICASPPSQVTHIVSPSASSTCLSPPAPLCECAVHAAHVSHATCDRPCCLHLPPLHSSPMSLTHPPL